MIRETHIKKNSGLSSYDLLLEEGIASIQKLAGSIWTDYNEHDPGVTILESICYSITDILNRINIPIENIISDAKGNLPTFSNAMHSARNIMHVNAVTENDLCKFIIDQSNEIRNAWIEPYFVTKNETHIGISGLYQVFIDFKRTSDNNKIITEQVFQTLNNSRNIAEIFPLCGLKIVTKIKRTVAFSLVINEDEYAEEIIANIFFLLQTYFRPEIKKYSYEDLKEQGYTTEEIFDGPCLNNGFILDTDLKKPIRNINIDVLTANICNIKGVKSIDNFTVIALSGPNLYDINEVVFDIDVVESIKNIIVSKKQKEYTIEPTLVQANLNDIISNNSKGFRTNYKAEDLDVAIKNYTQLKVDDYFSVQNEFPRIYGIGKNKLSNSSSGQRKAHALQLKGYLMLFEQLLSDLTVQLQNVKELFNIEKQNATYFYKPLYNVPDGPSLLKGFNLDPNYIYDSKNGDVYLKYVHNFVLNTENEFEVALTKLYEGYNKFIDRRNNFLDHLLSRFNFTSFDIPALLYSSPTNDMQKYSIEVKELILKNISEITANRNKYSWGDNSEANSIDPIYLKLIYFHTIGGLSYNKVTDSINSQLKHIVITNKKPEDLSKDKIYLNPELDNFNNIVISTFNNQNIFIRNIDSKSELVIKFNNKDIYSVELIDVEKKGTLKNIIEEIQIDFQVIFTEMSKLFIIDNISLLPNTDSYNFNIYNKNKISSSPSFVEQTYKDCFMGIINATEEIEVAVKNEENWISQNFFSSIITIILPDYNMSSDGKNTEQAYIEEMLKANLPAHISLQILYLNKDNLSNFKKNYTDWICKSNGNSLTNLVNFLITQPDYKNYLLNG